MEQQPDVRDYLARLHSELDSATLSAALSLLVTEGRTEISRQRTAIGLGRLEGRCTDDDVDQLRRLEATQEILTNDLAQQNALVHGERPAPQGALYPDEPADCGRGCPRREFPTGK